MAVLGRSRSGAPPPDQILAISLELDTGQVLEHSQNGCDQNLEQNKVDPIKGRAFCHKCQNAVILTRRLKFLQTEEESGLVVFLTNT